jgi:hypothetical protein
MFTWLIAGFLYLVFITFAAGGDSPFNIACQTGLAGYIWHIGGMGWLIGWLAIMALVAVSRSGH